MTNKKLKTDKIESRSNERKDSQEELKVKLAEAEQSWKRVLADYQNLEQRVSRERQALGQLATAAIIIELLPVLDNLETAALHINDQGLMLAIGQFKNILKNAGLEEIEAQNQEFDPHLHEAIEVTPGNEDNKIIEVINKGYKMFDKVIRPAKVKVSKKESN